MQNRSYGFGVEIPSAKQPNYLLGALNRRGTRRARIRNYQLSIINYQLSIINYQLSIINYHP